MYGLVGLVLLVGLMLVVCLLVVVLVLLRRASGPAATRSTPQPLARGAARHVDVVAPPHEVALGADGQVLRRATEEAQEVRRQAEASAHEVRRQAEESAQEVRRQAHVDAQAARERSEAEVQAASRQADEVALRAREEAAQLLAHAKEQAKRAEAEGRDARAALSAAEAALSARRDETRRFADDLERREGRLAERERRNDEERDALDGQRAELAAAEAQLSARTRELADAETERRRALERVAGLTADEARRELVDAVELSAKREAAVLVRTIESEARAEGETRARSIITTAVQRLASEQTAETVVSVLQLPSDDMKGRIIGREGRNIRTFESVTGVNLVVDDTPEAVLLSCFDPMRREVARLALENLVQDGRISPHRIEEVVARSREEVDQMCLRAGEDALIEVGIADLHPELVPILGRLRYRTSYGQNVLKHLVESAHLAGLMASELGISPEVPKRCALLHDIGKALSHEVGGSHALIGAELARKYAEHDDVVHAIEAHHNEVPPRTVEAVLTQAADAISGSRPGARRESLEAYITRMHRLEEIGGAHDGVDKVFAMQSGREVRVMVLPERVDDIQAQVIARDVAKQVEQELTYPGQIQITVVRESRAVEVAR